MEHPCSAPDCITLTNEPHCSKHKGLFTNLYLKYKRLEKYINQDQALPDSIPLLLKLYQKLRQAYTLRKEFREKAFKKEQWDQGHETRLSILAEKMFNIEEKLSKLFYAPSLKPETIIEVSSSCPEEDEEEISINEIPKINQQIAEELKCWNEEIPALIQQNLKFKQDVGGTLIPLQQYIYQLINSKTNGGLKDLEKEDVKAIVSLTTDIYVYIQLQYLIMVDAENTVLFSHILKPEWIKNHFCMSHTQIKLPFNRLVKIIEDDLLKDVSYLNILVMKIYEIVVSNMADTLQIIMLHYFVTHSSLVSPQEKNDKTQYDTIAIVKSDNELMIFQEESTSARDNVNILITTLNVKDPYHWIKALFIDVKKPCIDEMGYTYIQSLHNRK
jgi:hypothetical protein